MQVRQIMTEDVQVIHPDDTLQDAAERMRAFDIGALPVCDGERIVGMVTDRDLALRGVAEGLDPWTDHVSDVMSPEVICCVQDAEVAEAARLMGEKQVRRIVVLNRGRRLAGILSLGDLALNTSCDHMIWETLEQVCERSMDSVGCPT